MSRSWLHKLWKQIIASTSCAQTLCRKPRHTRLSVEYLEDRRLPSAFHVLDLFDSASDPGSLRYVLTEANATPGPNTIDFTNPATGTTLRGTITLTSGDQLVISNSVTIDGPGASQLSISGNSSTPGAATLGDSPSRVFQVDPGVSATLNGLTIENGAAPAADNVIYLPNGGVEVSFNQPDGGGGILNEGNLTLSNCDLSSNWGDYGGAISSYGSMNVNGSVFENNRSQFSGGGISNVLSGTNT